MFVLVEMKDTVRIQPWLFNLDVNEAIINELNKKFANKVSYRFLSAVEIKLSNVANLRELFTVNDSYTHICSEYRIEYILEKYPVCKILNLLEFW